MEVTRDRINEGGGIYGRMIEFIVQDDAYNQEKTVANAQYFIEQENVFAIWASIGSATLKAALLSMMSRPTFIVPMGSRFKFL